MADGAGGVRSTTPATPTYHLSFLLLLSLSLLVLSPLIPSPVRGDHHGDGDRESGDGRVDQDQLVEKKQEPDPAERAIGITGLTSRWDSIKTWAKLAWMNLRPPESGSVLASNIYRSPLIHVYFLILYMQGLGRMVLVTKAFRWLIVE